MSKNSKENISVLAKAEHKLKQLNEAHSMLEDIEWKLCWALDFSEYCSIDEQLNPVLDQVSNALEEVDTMREQLEEEIESYKVDKAFNEEEFDSSCNLVYSIF
jgi:hypothetical protein